MNIEQVRKLKPLDRLLYWITERESIRLKKEAGQPQPWTDDEVLGKFRFTNCRRMDDRVSQWLLTNWYQPYFNHHNMSVACALARFFNLPASLEPIQKYVFCDSKYGSGQAKRIKEILKKRRDEGSAVFNGAYIVCGLSGEEKIDSVIDTFVPSIAGVELNTDSMEESWKLLMKCKGLGSFTAGQIVADLRWAMEGIWADRNAWTSIGPGSKKGMNMLHGREVTQALPQKQFLQELLEFIEIAKARLPESMASRMEAIDWQNCFCEFFKFNKTVEGLGKPKQFYRPAQ